MRISAFLLLGALLLAPAAGCEQAYSVNTPHPRIWLNARHLRLLKRERERNSVRWQQLLAVENRDSFAEPPVVNALLYQAASDAEAGGRAAAWAVQRAGESGGPDDVEL